MTEIVFMVIKTFFSSTQLVKYQEKNYSYEKLWLKENLMNSKLNIKNYVSINSTEFFNYLDIDCKILFKPILIE